MLRQQNGDWDHEAVQVALLSVPEDQRELPPADLAVEVRDLHQARGRPAAVSDQLGRLVLLGQCQPQPLHESVCL